MGFLDRRGPNRQCMGLQVCHCLGMCEVYRVQGPQAGLPDTGLELAGGFEYGNVVATGKGYVYETGHL